MSICSKKKQFTSKPPLWKHPYYVANIFHNEFKEYHGKQIPFYQSFCYSSYLGNKWFTSCVHSSFNFTLCKVKKSFPYKGRNARTPNIIHQKALFLSFLFFIESHIIFQYGNIEENLGFI